jgi:hypothetical protein
VKAPFVVPTSIVTPSWLITVALQLLEHALSYHVLRACDPGSHRFAMLANPPHKGRVSHMTPQLA